MVLWVLGLILWAVVMYTFLTAVTVRENKPLFEAGMSGTWLLATVATQSISVLGTLLADHFRSYREPVLFLHAMYVLTRLYALFDPYHTHLLSFHFRQPHHCNAHSTLLD